jgi:hypothetical protein
MTYGLNSLRETYPESRARRPAQWRSRKG